MSCSAFTLALILVCPLCTLIAQTGPGGVGDNSDNGLWLRADALELADGTAVSQWADQSGNVNDARQTNAAIQPLYVASSSINGMPTVRLEATNNDRMSVADADILDGSVGITYFAVIRPTSLDGNPRGILGKRTDQGTRDDTYAYTWYFHNDNNLRLDVNQQDDRFGADVSFQNNQNYLLGWDFEGTRPANTRSRIYNGGVAIAQSFESLTTVYNSPQPLVLGALNDIYPQYLGADYAEVIQYNRSLGLLERRLVNNYLSGKYSIPLAAGDVYAQDDPSNGDYDFDIAGIGRRTASDQVTNARGSGLLRVSGATDLDDDEHLLWGHDGQATSSVVTDDVPPGIDSRLARSWRVSEVSLTGTPVEVGAIDMEFNLGGVSFFNEDNLRLLVDTDNDGNFADEAPLSGAFLTDAETYTFAGVTSIADGRRFTVATATARLPVYLTHFGAELRGNSTVALHWQTNLETDNDYFSIERSPNGQGWQQIGRTGGRGTTSRQSSYEFTDTEVPTGRMHYRLRQVDFDGTYSLSTMVVVVVPPAERSLAYPNPTSDWLYLPPGGNDDREVTLLDAGGTVVHRSIGREKHRLNLTDLPPGHYLIRRGRTVETIIKR